MISITDGLQAIYNSNMKEKTPLELEREIRQLTNNWNELEEWLDINDRYSRGYFKKVLDKMKEMKEGKDVR